MQQILPLNIATALNVMLGASLLEENLEKKVELFKVPCMEMGGRLL
jgi:hypothetical protein